VALDGLTGISPGNADFKEYCFNAPKARIEGAANKTAFAGAGRDVIFRNGFQWRDGVE
jgi:hypothetical protein